MNNANKALAAILCMLTFTLCSCGTAADGIAETDALSAAATEAPDETEFVADAQTEGEETMPSNTFPLVSEGLPEAVSDTSAVSDGDKNTFCTLEDGALVLIFDEITAFDRVVLRETAGSKGGCCRAFHIDAWNGEEWIEIYSNDLIDNYRLCVVDELSCRAVRLVIDEDSGKSVKINEMSVKKAEKPDVSGFRVMAYVHPNGYIYNTLVKEETAAQSEIVTDIIFNGFLHWNKDGDGLALEFSDDFERYHTLFEELFTVKRTHLGLNNRCDLVNDEAVLTALADETVETAIKYGFDGVSIDYEYPYSNNAYAAFNSFLVLLGDRLHESDMELSVAVGLWNNHLDSAAVNTVDVFNIMSYDDQTDFKSWHSTFRFASDEIQNAISAGFPIEKVNLGVPFYGEGTKVEKGIYKIDWDRSTSYAHIYSSLGGNFDPGLNLYDGYYYNGPTMMRDKTALALERGCGGIMIWALNHDIPCTEQYSLLKSISDILAE